MTTQNANLLVTAAQSRELDRMAIEDEGIAGSVLMARAGQASFDALLSRWKECTDLVIFCGAGNNAGDGYVIARLASEQGMGVRVVSLSEPSRLRGDAAGAFEEYSSVSDGQTCSLNEAVEQNLLTQSSNATVIIDALLGTGIDRVVEGQYAQAIELINASGFPVVAVDIPSGINADTGCIMGCAVRASLTCTFIAPKQGLYTGDARDMCGEIVFDDLDVPEKLYSRVGPVVTLTSAAGIASSLLARPVNSHKGMYGAVAVIGGSPGMSGAALLSARAALRSGAGMVKIAVFPGQDSSTYTVFPEAMTALLGTPDALQSLQDWASVIAVGPGLGLTTEATDLFESALVCDKPKVIDADGLTLLARSQAKLTNAVLTPHPGEAARLLGCTTADVQQNRFQSAVEIARRYNSVCILKGAGSVVADVCGTRTLCAAGNPGMASAGMGDVLTGVVAALLAQGLDPLSAASTGVQLHAMAGDRAAESGQRGLLATDVIDELRGCINP